MSYVNIDVSEMKKFFESVSKLGNGDLKKELRMFMEGLGNEFLRVLQDEIIRRKVMDTRQLLASFRKGGEDNIWELDEGNLTLEIGTSVNYAGYVNDGHWTNPKGVEKRFVPGHWNGGRFIYDPSAKGGMILKQKWVEGKHYWESAIRIIERIYPALLEEKLQRFIDDYFL